MSPVKDTEGNFCLPSVSPVSPVSPVRCPDLAKFSNFQECKQFWGASEPSDQIAVYVEVGLARFCVFGRVWTAAFLGRGGPCSLQNAPSRPGRRLHSDHNRPPRLAGFERCWRQTQGYVSRWERFRRRPCRVVRGFRRV